MGNESMRFRLLQGQNIFQFLKIENTNTQQNTSVQGYISWEIQLYELVRTNALTRPLMCIAMN